MSAALITDLKRRIDDLVAEPSLAKRIELGRDLRLWIAAEISPADLVFRGSTPGASRTVPDAAGFSDEFPGSAA